MRYEVFIKGTKDKVGEISQETLEFIKEQTQWPQNNFEEEPIEK